MKGLPLLGRWRWGTHDLVPAAATTRDVYSPQVPRGQIRHVNRVMAYNADTANSVLIISVEQAGETTEVYYVKLVSAATWYPVKLETLVFPEERLKYAFSVCTAADDLYVREVGQHYEWTEQGPRSASEVFARGVEAKAGAPL